MRFRTLFLNLFRDTSFFPVSSAQGALGSPLEPDNHSPVFREILFIGQDPQPLSPPIIPIFCAHLQGLAMTLWRRGLAVAGLSHSRGIPHELLSRVASFRIRPRIRARRPVEIRQPRDGDDSHGRRLVGRARQGVVCVRLGAGRRSNPARAWSSTFRRLGRMHPSTSR
ncbi:hypothetical protein C8F04DRAFT_1066220 [Mycena alexandri]|uniref:Uncharacterized protein n=1 Tax=Mycena alexandri TaxID=1745969 RepID=A0AAD6XEZ1_9AGAR|nr:hypothetical protein C8F04DRAFT_1066220 [Mycena alexandri]